VRRETKRRKKEKKKKRRKGETALDFISLAQRKSQENRFFVQALCPRKNSVGQWAAIDMPAN
jgi:hypothetical protein